VKRFGHVCGSQRSPTHFIDGSELVKMMFVLYFISISVAIASGQTPAQRAQKLVSLMTAAEKYTIVNGKSQSSSIYCGLTIRRGLGCEWQSNEQLLRR
jgi:hypothetical protein